MHVFDFTFDFISPFEIFCLIPCLNLLTQNNIIRKGHLFLFVIIDQIDQGIGNQNLRKVKDVSS